MEISKIIFPVDLAGSSYRIAPKVRSIAEKYGAELHLVYVGETLEGFDTFFVPHRSLDLMEREARTLAQRHLEDFAEKYFEDLPKVKKVVLSGDPVEQIRKYIESERIDMVVLAYHDQLLLERAIFGDIVQQIVRSSTVPVTLINPFVEERMQIPA